LNPLAINEVIIAVTYSTIPNQSILFFAINAQFLSASYANIGYTANANSYISVNINNSIPDASPTLAIPINSIKISCQNLNDLNIITQNSILRSKDPLLNSLLR
jgi:hypothetical protein